MDSGDEYFFHNFICSSDDSSLDDEDLVVAALVVHDHISRKRPRFRGSIPGHAPALDRSREKGHTLMLITLRMVHSLGHINLVVDSE